MGLAPLGRRAEGGAAEDARTHAEHARQPEKELLAKVLCVLSVLCVSTSVAGSGREPCMSQGVLFTSGTAIVVAVCLQAASDDRLRAEQLAREGRTADAMAGD